MHLIHGSSYKNGILTSSPSLKHLIVEPRKGKKEKDWKEERKEEGKEKREKRRGKRRGIVKILHDDERERKLVKGMEQSCLNVERRENPEIFVLKVPFLFLAPLSFP